MAGGKETPRQKMIGMMYLVLTALLALNVSSTVIDKFVFINESLHEANKETEARNVQVLQSIEQAVEDLGNREKDVVFVELSNEIRAKTEEVSAQIVEYKKIMVDITDGYEEGHEPDYPGDAKHLLGKTNYDAVGNYMMPEEEGGQGHGAKLKEVLNDYAAFVKQKLESVGAKPEVTSHFVNIARDADEDEVYSQDPNQQGKKFSQLAFENSPTPASLATMSEFQARVLSYETRAFDYISSKIGAGDLQFDKIVAMVKPKSNYIAAGTKYEAEMFIAASASGITPTMTVDGNEIPVEEGMGKVEFTASAGKYDEEGNAKKSFEAAITVPTPAGDTTYTNTIDYYVVKPVIQIQSQSVNALYLNCGNKLDVQVPALGNSYAPKFTAKGGYAIAGKARGAVTVVPNSAKVVLTVSSSGNRIGNREFGVRRIPQPEIKVFDQARKEVNPKQGISARTTQIFIQAVPDESFAQFLPDDAKFRVAEAEVTLVSGGLGKGSVRGGAQVNLGGLAGNARAGNSYVIEIKKVQRQNFRGQVEDFNRFTKYVTIPLN